MNDEKTVVEEVRLSDFNSVDEDFSGGGKAAGGGGNCEAAVCGERFNLGAEV
ncbi:UNVERIFIED_CONTAM: hypothetical protein Sradi_0280900 [Sesamum radiatum]|uniref:Uncharacterized protein n=1 Tax=Sesamum radiatum TaxID=300843 RepID=A0AAW2W238_SESRA